MRQEVLAEAAGEFQTPCYVFDLDRLREDVAEMKTLLADRVGLCFAMKANPFLTEEMAEMTDYIEVCSPGELRICIEQKIPAEKMILSGVLKEEQDIRELLEKEKLPHFTAESMDQVDLFLRLSREYGRNVELLLRLTSGNQFGMDEDVLLESVDKILQQKYVQFAGIHFFSGTQKRKSEQIRKELGQLAEVCDRIWERFGLKVPWLEYGPGFGVEYFKGTKKWGREEALAMLSDAADCVTELHFPGTVTFEMGRFLAAMCGSFVTKVREVKENQGTRYCLVDAGMHHLNYDGQVMAMKTPFCTPLFAREGEEEQNYCICGALCTANDILIRQYPLKSVRPGDLLVFERTGAYSMTEGMSLFLSRDLPAVVSYCKTEGFRVLRSRMPVYPLNKAADRIL